MITTSRSMMGALVGALALVSCADNASDDASGEPSSAGAEPAAETGAASPPQGMMTGSSVTSEEARAALRAATSSELRGEAAARDKFRHPTETLLFFGARPDQTIVEIWPGGGWYTDILAPFLASGGGKLYAAHYDPSSDNERVRRSLDAYDAKYVGNPAIYGEVEMTSLSQGNRAIAPAGSADLVLTFRNVHNFTMGGWGAEAFAAFFEALKPGGTLGVVEHRLPEAADLSREMSSGYVKVSTVRTLAEGAGFIFDGSSEVNANSKDDADHPFGVWTLPPRSRTTDRDGNAPEGFDAAEYLAIGESDRMTLRFKKPIQPEEALLE